MKKNLFIEELPEATGVFVESAVVDDFNNLVFASLWGHTAAIQNSIGRITTGDLSEVSINGYLVCVDKNMTKKVGKLPKDNDYGDMTHAFIYRPTTLEEKAGRREILFAHEPPETLIFDVIKTMSVFPLLDNWLKLLLQTFRAKEMLVDLKTLCGNVHGIHINLGNEDEYAELLKFLIQYRQLRIVGGS